MCVCHGQVRRMEDSRVISMELDLDAESQKMKGRLKRTWKKQVEENCMHIG